jgi:MFS family permease
MPFDNDRAITGLTATGHALVHTYELSIPIFMTVWLAEFGLTSATLGVLVTAGYALFGIGAVPGGVLADRYGSKRLVLACLAGMGGSFLVLSLAQGPALITAGLVLWGAAASVYHPAGLALISKGARRRGHTFAYHGIAGNLGTALGPLATTVLLLFFDWRVVSALLAGPALLVLPVLWRMEIDETAAIEPAAAERAGDAPFSWRQFGRDSRLLFASAFGIIFLTIMLQGMYYRGMLTFLPDLLGRLAALEPVQVGALTLQPSRFVYVGLLLVGVAGQYTGGRLTDRVRLEPAIAATFAALAVIAAVFLPLARQGLVPLLGISAVLGFVLFGVQPLYQAAIAKHSPADARGLSYGYNYLGVFGVGALGAALAGGVLTRFGPPVLFGVLAALVVIAAAVMLLLARRTARQTA